MLGAGLVATMPLLQACGATATPTAAPTATTAPKPTTAPAAATPVAAQPTAAPAQPTAAPTQAKPVATATAAAPSGGSGLGKNLIGKYEPWQAFTDTAAFPKAYKEAPQLADLVKAGKLPAVKDRLPAEPVVIKPASAIGAYGGILRRGFTGPGDGPNGKRIASGPDSLMAWDGTAQKIIPWVAKQVVESDGGKTFTITLRKGMRWSDGEPFNADDIVFWYEDLAMNKELVPTPGAGITINGKPGTVEKVDDVTVHFKFPDPYYLFFDQLTNYSQPDGYNGYYAPKHYLKQFHPKYAAKDALDKAVKDAGFDSWVKLMGAMINWNVNLDLPVISPFKMTSPSNAPQWVFGRNPYSIWVDTEGNQLPYLDQIVMTVAENLEVVNLRAIAGEYDEQERHLDLAKLPVFLESQTKGNYTLHLDPADWGGDMIIKFNMGYEADPEIAKLFNTTDFRRALSLGVDRDQLNEMYWLGLGTPGSVVPSEATPYNPGPEYRKLWATYDPQKANAMLDSIGLTKKDADGFRQRSDGKGRLTITMSSVDGFMAYTKISETIKEHWKKIGIDLNVKATERALATTQCGANETQLSPWVNDGSETTFVFNNHVIVQGADVVCSGPTLRQWLNTGGKQGKEPPAPMKQQYDNWVKGFGAPEAERIKLGKEIWKINAEEVYMIGICGLSPAAGGVRVVKNGLGNIPARQVMTPLTRTPSGSLPMTWYWKK